ncbi:MAG: DUF393 domain-containing protein [Acidobacteria bacterium]|nr:MAG: DUF393 domain-containing protein [Acidobacteriota bacterium]REK11093.1 MAG: DUF393 domain-containing protein [Acidobacteriota bacterium]
MTSERPSAATPHRASAAHAGRPVLLFDGVCNLCNASVDFVLRHERDDRLLFASLQSRVAARLLAEHGTSSEELPDSMVLLEDGRVWTRSDAIFGVVRHLRPAFSWLRILRWLPRPLRDLFYRFVAHHRYRVFGRRDSCRLPTPEERARFLDAAEPDEETPGDAGDAPTDAGGRRALGGAKS